MTFTKWKEDNLEQLTKNFENRPRQLIHNFNEFCYFEYWNMTMPTGMTRKDLELMGKKWIT